MKIKFQVLLIFVLFLLQCGKATTTENNQKCRSLGERANILIMKYSFFKDTTYARLDSALSLIESIYPDCPKYYAGLSISKLKIFCLKKSYSDAINFTKTLDDKAIHPQNKSILLKRFYAMNAQYKGNKKARNQYISSIISELKDTLLNLNMDSVLQIPNELEILKNAKGLAVIQFYYFRAQIEGVKTIKQELELYQKKINGNQKIFKNVLIRSLEEDFMIFNGL